MKKAIILLLLLLIISIISCSKTKSNENTSTKGTDTIIFTANGEDFVRQGFTDKNGWKITFNYLYINITEPTAYMPDLSNKTAVLPGIHLTDLAAGNENAEPLIIGRLKNIPYGNYQSLKFSIKRCDSGKYTDYSIIMIGTAERESEIVDFIIKLDEEMDFDGREGFVGNEIKGLLQKDNSTTVEMTFHFDHIFGDAEAGESDHINTGSVGFDYFYEFMKNGKVEVTQKVLKNTEEYEKLIHSLWTLGHLGEGHCDVSNQSSAGEF